MFAPAACAPARSGPPTPARASRAEPAICMSASATSAPASRPAARARTHEGARRGDGAAAARHGGSAFRLELERARWTGSPALRGRRIARLSCSSAPRPFLVCSAEAAPSSADAGEPAADPTASSGERPLRGPAWLLAAVLDRVLGRTDASRRAWALLRPESGLLAAGLASALVATSANVVSPLLFGSLVDSVFRSRREQFARTIACMVAIYVLEPLCTALYVGAVSAAGERAVERLRVALASAVARERIEFFDTTPSGAITGVLAGDVVHLKTLWLGNLPRDRGLRAMLELVAGSCLILRMQPLLAAPFLFVLYPVAATAVYFGARAARLQAEEGKAVGAANALAGEVVSNIRSVRTFSSGVQAAILRRLAEEAARAGRAARAQGRAQGLKEAVTRASINLTILAVALIGGALALAGRMQPATLSSFLGYSFSLNFALQGLSYTWSDVRGAAGPAARVLATLARAPAAPAAEALRAGAGESPAPPALHGRVAFRSVSFRYPSRPDALVLRDVSFEVEPGQKLALVGPSGAGKSTITHLLSGFYEPEAGRIEVDGRDIRACSPDWLRDHVAVVSQEPALFSGTIRQNIAYGARSGAVPDADIEAAARAAYCHDFIAGLPEGYETRVGERGVQLSGGQRQRIAIARALLKDPSVLILDEATSALDSESEAAVSMALQRVMAGRTTILIAHRLATVRGADQIAVLVPGLPGFAEVGRHEELVRRPGGAYRALLDKQASI